MENLSLIDWPMVAFGDSWIVGLSETNGGVGTVIVGSVQRMVHEKRILTSQPLKGWRNVTFSQHAIVGDLSSGSSTGLDKKAYPDPRHGWDRYRCVVGSAKSRACLRELDIPGPVPIISKEEHTEALLRIYRELF